MTFQPDEAPQGKDGLHSLYNGDSLTRCVWLGHCYSCKSKSNAFLIYRGPYIITLIALPAIKACIPLQEDAVLLH